MLEILLPRTVCIMRMNPGCPIGIMGLYKSIYFLVLFGGLSGQDTAHILLPRFPDHLLRIRKLPAKTGSDQCHSK